MTVATDPRPQNLTAPVPAVRYGGPRLQPDHYEPERVPPQVAAYGTGGGVLDVGSPGKVGVLELAFELRGPPGRRRTELVHRFQKSPLQIMRPLYYDESRPDMPYTYLTTTGGGVLHGDRLRIDLRLGAGTSTHTTTQAHTRLYRMEHGYAASTLSIEAAEDAYVEYLPDPVIPYGASRYFQSTRVTLHPSATLVLGDTFYAGRLSRGEVHEYDVYATDVVVERPDGTPVLIDRCRLEPQDGSIVGPGVLGGHTAVSTLYVLSPLVPAADLADRLHDAVGGAMTDGRFGVSTLPGELGAWVRVVGDDTVALAAVNRVAWRTAREVLTGRAAPEIRK